VIERDGVDVNWAKVETLGSTVVDAFGLSDFTASREDLERDLYAVLPAPPPVKVSEAS
jgi:[protein-PII] uridylyltransferase